MGIAFVKQYAQSGLEVPLFGPAFSFDQGILGAVGDAALGVKNTSQWSKDLDNAANKAFVESLQKERSDEHTSDLHSLMRTSYDVSCLTQKKNITNQTSK